MPLPGAPASVRVALLLLVAVVFAPTSGASTLQCVALTEVERGVAQTGHNVTVTVVECRQADTFAFKHARANVTDARGPVLVLDATTQRNGDRDGAHAFNWTVVAQPRGADGAIWFSSARDAEGYTRCSVSGYLVAPTGLTLFSTGFLALCVPQETLLP